MVKLLGKNWSGILFFNVTPTASGRVNSYSWYFESKATSWVIEIAEDHDIEPTDLPLVGFGCGGWLYECEQCTLPNNEIDLIHRIQKELKLVFTLFKQNKLNYIPAVTSCSD